MSAAATSRNCGGRLPGAGRVLVSFAAAIVLVGLALTSWFGPLAAVYPAGALLLGFPSLILAIALRAIYHRSIEAHLLAWCLAAPFVVSAACIFFWWAVDYRQRGYGFLNYLAIDGIGAEAVLGLVFGAVASLIFYVWERRSRGG